MLAGRRCVLSGETEKDISERVLVRVLGQLGASRACTSGSNAGARPGSCAYWPRRRGAPVGSESSTCSRGARAECGPWRSLTSCRNEGSRCSCSPGCRPGAAFPGHPVAGRGTLHRRACGRLVSGGRHRDTGVHSCNPTGCGTVSTPGLGFPAGGNSRQIRATRSHINLHSRPLATISPSRKIAYL